LSEIFSGLREAVKKFVTGSTSYEKAVEAFIRDLQRELIRSDVNVKIVSDLSTKIKKRALEEKPPPGLSRHDWFIKIVYEELVQLLGGDYEPDVIPKKKPYIIMLVGLQGSGKTTTAAKIAWYYKNRKLKPGLIETDTYRPGAYDQLKQLAEKIKVPFYGDAASKDPVDIALKGVSKMLKEKTDIIIIDTAGRHGYGEEEGLLTEMKLLAEKLKPYEVMFVLDASIGQKAKDIAEKFHSATPIGSIVISKLDGSAKGGGAIAAVAVTKAKIKFVGTGEKIEDIEVFKPKRFIARILGLGDLEGLLERVSMYQTPEEQKKIIEDVLTGKIDMKTIYAQIRQVRRMGPLSKILKMIPGFSLQLPGEEQVKLTEKKMDKWIAIIQSMTYEELEKPELIEKEKTRLRRIAMGSGTTTDDVKELVEYYKQLKKISLQLKRRKDILKRLEEQFQSMGS
jgi:signal recognition particle subunit SRP54